MPLFVDESQRLVVVVAELRNVDIDALKLIWNAWLGGLDSESVGITAFGFSAAVSVNASQD